MEEPEVRRRTLNALRCIFRKLPSLLMILKLVLNIRVESDTIIVILFWMFNVIRN